MSCLRGGGGSHDVDACCVWRHNTCGACACRDQHVSCCRDAFHLSTSLLLAPSSPPSRELTVRILNSVDLSVVSTHYLRSSTDKLGVYGTPLLQIWTENISRSYLIRVLQILSQDARKPTWVPTRVLFVLHMDTHGYVGFSVDAIVTRAWTIPWMKFRNCHFKSGTKILSDGTFIGIEMRTLNCSTVYGHDGRPARRKNCPLRINRYTVGSAFPCRVEC